MSDSIKKTLYFIPFVIAGGSAYVLIEILFRGYSHISMFVLGGICLTLVDIADRAFYRLGTLPKAVICGLIISIAELIAGIVLNLYMELYVWDYSNMRFNLLGQICPQFSVMWILLSIPALYLARAVRRYTLSALRC